MAGRPGFQTGLLLFFPSVIECYCFFDDVTARQFLCMFMYDSCSNSFDLVCHEDLDQEHQQSAQEAEELQQQLSKAAADTWRHVVTLCSSDTL